MPRFPRRIAKASVYAVSLTVGCCLLYGCHNEEKPAANSGYYSGSDYSKGGNTSLPGRGPAKGGAAAPGAQSQ